MPLLQAISVVIALALCPEVVPQAPQHFRSAKTQAQDAADRQAMHF